MMRYYARGAMVALALGWVAAPVAAQEQGGTPPSAPVPSMPRLDFVETPEIAATYDKYFYFHRDANTLDEAKADITECDALSSGSSIYLGGDQMLQTQMIVQYGLAGGVGGAIGAAAADAIFGSAQRRAQYRVNMRNCMGWKGYQRYGLSKDLWDNFHFEEGNGRKKEEVRLVALTQQAMVASGPKPATKELGQ